MEIDSDCGRSHSESYESASTPGPVPTNEIREQLAIDLLERQEARSSRSAAEMVGIRPSTLRNRMQGRKTKKEDGEKRQKLTPTEESFLVERCEQLGRLGFPLTVEEVRECALAIYQTRIPNGTLGKNWVRDSLYKRHPEVRSRFSKQMDYKRSICGNSPNIINNYFDMYESVIQQFEIKPHNMYNIDEIGFLMGVGASERVVEVVRHPRENGELVQRTQDGSRDFATVIEGICGNGSALESPCIILKAKEFIEEWFENLPEVPQNTLFGRSNNGWTDEKMSLRFLKRNFGPGSKSAEKAEEEFRLLLFDGHNSHVNSRFLSYCLETKVIPLCLPPHTTHRLQPLDVAVFSAYKHYYRKELRQRWAWRVWGVGKDNFYQIINIARQKAFSEKNIRSAFWFTGHIPSNCEIVLREILTAPNPAPFTTHIHSTSPSPPSTPPPLDSQSIVDIARLTTPKTSDQLHYQQKLSQSFNISTSPQSWKKEHLQKNIAHAAEHSMLRAEAQEQDRKNILASERQRQEKRKKNRQLIPTDGQAWLDVSKVNQFFEKQTDKKKKALKAKQTGVSKMILRQKSLLTELHRKEAQAAAREESNTLPRSWKPSSYHREAAEQVSKKLQSSIAKESALQTAEPAMEEGWQDGCPAYSPENGLEVEQNTNTLALSSPSASSHHTETRVFIEVSHSREAREENSAFDFQSVCRNEEGFVEDEEIVDRGSSDLSDAATPTPHLV